MMTMHGVIRQYVKSELNRNLGSNPITIATQIIESQEIKKQLILQASFWDIVISDDEMLETLQNYLNELQRVEGIEEGIFRKRSDLNGYVLSSDGGNDACWDMYLNKLRSQNRSKNDLNRIIDECNVLVQQFIPQPAQPSNRKGLVIGQVQSGKTTIFNGIISAAADMGFNIILILSGTIESLRKQTQKRIHDDVTSPWDNKDGSQFSFQWISNHDGPGLAVAGNASKILPRICNTDSQRQVAIGVFLKNKNVLKNLSNFLNTINPTHHAKIRALVIDDEADQATPNAGVKKQTITALNLGIKSLINIPTSGTTNVLQGKSCYLGFTATPFANLLNEAGEDTLYPKDFLYFLKSSNRYFGPWQLFGNPDEMEEDESIIPINVIRYLNQDDINGTVPRKSVPFSPSITNGLRDSLRWYILSATMRRIINPNCWATMLIHTSSNTSPHQKVHSVVSTYINNIYNDFIANYDEWKKFWENEKRKVTIENFKKAFPNYGLPQPNDYPSWEEIVNNIESVCQDVKVKIDNSLYSGSERLSFPDDINNSDKLQIAIGGNTLSRGLTLEGLVSSYFARSTNTYDALLQMGRWFGFRQGYELLPRLWTTESLGIGFQELVIIETNLRKSMELYLKGDSPAGKAPIITNMPSMALTRNSVIGNVNKVSVDYSGSAPQTILFLNEKEKLELNLNKTTELINKINSKLIYTSKNKNKKIFKDIKLVDIIEYLQNISLWQGTNTFNLKFLIDFINKNETKYQNWNVVLYGGKSENEFLDTGVKMNNRSRIINPNEDPIETNPKIINIKSLRSTTDLVCDIIDFKYSTTYKETDYWEIRKRENLNPVLIIYPIDKDSKKTRDNEYRTDLGALEHVIGLSLILAPPNSSSGAEGVQLDLGDTYKNDEDSEDNPDLPDELEIVL
jgi:hypothetical protein